MTNDLDNQAVETAGDNGPDFESMRQTQIDREIFRGIAAFDEILAANIPRRVADCNCGAQDGPMHRPHRDNCSVYETG